MHEPVPSRRHTEEMLELFGASITRVDDRITVERSSLRPHDIDVPGDPSQAAFWLALAAATPQSQLTVSNLYLGPHRDTFLAVLARMGADLTIDHATGSVSVAGRELRATDVVADEVAGLIDEFPALAIAAAFASGTSTVHGAEELRVKESDRIATIVSLLRSFGVSVREFDDGYAIDGPSRLQPASVDAHGDHRIAMAAALLGASADGISTIRGWSCVRTSYPNFVEHLHAIISDGR